MATRVNPHDTLPFASRRRPRFQRDSGVFWAARPKPQPEVELEDLPVVDAEPVKQLPNGPRVARTANLNQPDTAPKGPAPRTVKQDMRALGYAFLAGVGLPLAAVVLNALS